MSWDTAVSVGVGAAIALLVAWLTGYANLRTLQLTLEAEDRRRLWEARVETYSELIAQTLNRQALRQVQLGFATYADDEYVAKFAQDALAEDTPRRWFYFQGRVHALASDEVRAAFEVAMNADTVACSRKQNVDELVASSTNPDGVEQAMQRAKRAAEEALRADTTLIELIRNELQRAERTR